MKRFWVFILILVLGTAVFLPMSSRADFGDYSGGSDYGGYDSGGYDYSGGSDYSGGYDWSSSDSDSYYYGSGGSYSSGMNFGTLPVVIILVFIVFVYLLFRRSFGNPRRDLPQGATRTAITALTPVENYTRLDPNFDASAFSEKLSNLYVQMQNAWQAKDIEPVRPYLTDAFYAQMERQLSAYITGKKTNRVERIAVLGVILRGYFTRDGSDHMVAELRTRITDYVVDDTTGKVISGDPSKEKFMTYEWTLSRPSGIITEKEPEMRTINCPNCGAAVSINASAKCPYCGSVITLTSHDWALYSIKGIAQRTV
jgi:hypothetical protein